MKRVVSILAVLFVLATGMSAQDVVSEARTKRAQEHHDSLVSKAKELLQEKEDLEAKLAAVNAKLDKLAKGEDVDMPSGALVYSNGSTLTTSCCYLTVK